MFTKYGLRLYLLVFIIFGSPQLFAEVKYLPNSFESNDKKNNVFIDILEADYQIRFDLNHKKAFSTSKISFRQYETGYPVFALKDSSYYLTINDTQATTTSVKLPGVDDTIKRLEKELPPGFHTLTITHFLSQELNNKTVEFGTFMKDMRKKNFLEKYVPTNLEYDQYKAQFEIIISGAEKEHEVLSNGELTKLNSNHFSIEMPKWYNSSSFFFHIFPKNKFKQTHFYYKSINGIYVPVTIYSKSNLFNRIMKIRTINILEELENDYEAYPHDKLLIYAKDLTGGMEYAGATQTSFFALGHELQHMYFARGVLPANGNSGWIDEGIAKWRDYFHQSHRKIKFKESMIGGHSPYRRHTDICSYKHGRQFISHLNFLTSRDTDKDFKDFLKFYFNKRKYTVVTTQDFIDDLKIFFNIDYTPIFNKYIFGIKKEN